MSKETPTLGKAAFTLLHRHWVFLGLTYRQLGRVGDEAALHPQTLHGLIRHSHRQLPWVARALQGNRRAGAQMVVTHLQALGPLRPGLETTRATDLLWVFNDPAHYNALVLQCGWHETEFTGWLSSHMRQALLPA